MNQSPPFDADDSAAIRQAADSPVDASRHPRKRRRVALTVSIVAVATLILVGGAAFVANSVRQSRGESHGSVAVAPTPPPTSAAADPSAAGPTASGPTATGTPGHVVGADPADASTWIISALGIGPLTIGGDVTKQVAEQSAYAGRSMDDPASGQRCSAWIFESKRFPTIDVAPGRGGATDWILVGRSPVTQTLESGPRTEAGIGSGSTLTALKGAYPSLTVTQDVYPDHGYVQYSVALDGGTFLTFQMSGSGSTVELILVSSSPGIRPEVC